MTPTQVVFFVNIEKFLIRDILKNICERLLQGRSKAAFPLVDCFRTNEPFLPLIHHIRNNINYLAEVVAKEKVETLSTLEKRKNSLTNHIAKNLSYDKFCHMTQTNMISLKQAHANGNYSYNKPSTIRIKQIFSCSLKTR